MNRIVKITAAAAGCLLMLSFAPIHWLHQEARGRDGKLSTDASLGMKPGDTVTDIDGNTYSTLKIGRQIWMAENLKVTRYRNGDSIGLVTDENKWSYLTTGGWCFYRNMPSFDSSYGKIYNWYAVNDKRGLCPKGWHIPTDSDWNILVDYLGGKTKAGSMKALSLWDPPNGGAASKAGFAATPGGLRNYYGMFKGIGTFGYYWSSTATERGTAWFRKLTCYDAKVNRDDVLKETGFSCRCIKD